MESQIRGISFGVLAGGKSSRMGTDKASLRVGAKTFLETVLEAGSAFEERMVSLPRSCGEETLQKLAQLGVTAVRDGQDDAGPLEGIRQLLLRASCGACLVTATDMPFLTGDFLAALAGRYCGSGNLVLTLDGRPEPLCSIYCRECIPAIGELQKQGLGRPALLYRSVPTQYLPLEELGFDRAVVRNINTGEDYQTYIGV